VIETAKIATENENLPLPNAVGSPNRAPVSGHAKHVQLTLIHVRAVESLNRLDHLIGLISQLAFHGQQHRADFYAEQWSHNGLGKRCVYSLIYPGHRHTRLLEQNEKRSFRKV
jgi:hypothetical protein